MDRQIDAGMTLVMERLLEIAGQDAAVSKALREIAAFVLERCVSPTANVDVVIDGRECSAPSEEHKSLEEASAQGVEPAQSLPPLVMTVGFSAEGALANSSVYTSDFQNVTQDVSFDSNEASTATPEKLELLVEQLTLKAEACRWALENPEHRDHGPQELWKRADGKEGHLWMLSRFRPRGKDDQTWEQLASAFEAAATSGVAMLRVVGDATVDGQLAGSVYSVCMEAQVALRQTVRGVGQGYDLSQVQLLRWLECFAKNCELPSIKTPSAGERSSVHVDEVIERARGIQAATHEVLEGSKLRKELLGRARYHARKIPNGRPDEFARDWQRVATALNELVRTCDLPPSSKEIRQILAPIYDCLPDMNDELPGFDLCLQAHDTYLSQHFGSVQASLPAPPTECLEAVRGLLRGKRVVLIGGDMNPGAKARIEKAFELAELVWVRSRAHQSVSSFRPHIVRPDVALVLLAIRWSSHSYGDVKLYCDESGKPLVRLTSGYGPNQLANQIFEQSGHRLKKAHRHERRMLEVI